jgi:anaerobic magnesium-protoporphyrin IX monomethyl ester cyclase
VHVRLDRGEDAAANVDVLLLHLIDRYNTEQMQTDVFAPIGLASIAACLERAGRSVHFARAIFEPGRDPAPPAGVRPRVIGMSATGNEIATLKRLSHHLRADFPDATLVAGGYCSLDGENLFADSALDALVMGEGEMTAVELVDAAITGRSFDGIDGLIFRDGDGRVQRTAPRASILALDTLPLPVYDPLPRDSAIIRVYASRGCPYRCTFCEIKDFYAGRGIRRHGAAWVRDLVQALLDRHPGGAEFLYFNDDEFLLEPKHLVEMGGVARELGLKICFQTRVSDVVKHLAVIREHADVIHQVHMGVETFAQSLLDRWKKGVKVSVNWNAMRVLSDAGISYRPYIILSDKDTTPAEIAATCDGLLRLPPCPHAVRTASGPAHPVFSPLYKNLHLNRMKTFYGDVERDERTHYLGAMWAFVMATREESRGLSDLFIRAHCDMMPKAGEPLRELMDDRIRMASEIAGRAAALTVRSGMELAEASAAAYRERARRARIDFMADFLLAAGASPAVPALTH